MLKHGLLGPEAMKYVIPYHNKRFRIAVRFEIEMISKEVLKRDFTLISVASISVLK